MKCDFPTQTNLPELDRFKIDLSNYFRRSILRVHYHGSTINNPTNSAGTKNIVIYRFDISR